MPAGDGKNPLYFLYTISMSYNSAVSQSVSHNSNDCEKINIASDAMFLMNRWQRWRKWQKSPAINCHNKWFSFVVTAKLSSLSIQNVVLRLQTIYFIRLHWLWMIMTGDEYGTQIFNGVTCGVRIKIVLWRTATTTAAAESNTRDRTKRLLLKLWNKKTAAPSPVPREHFSCQ